MNTLSAWIPPGAPSQDHRVDVTEFESGAVFYLGRRLELTITIATAAATELEPSWSEVTSRLARWREKRGERAREITIWYSA